MLGGILQIQYAENHGAFLSLLANLPPEARFWMLTVGNSLALLWLAGFLLTHPKLERIPFCALTCVLCGGIGNLIDRVCLDGIVIDFLNVGVMLGKVPLRTGIFNVADMAITGGAMLLVPWMFKSPQDEGLGSGAAIKC